MEKSERYLETAALISKFLKAELTPEEAEQLKVWIEENDEHAKLWERLTDPAYLEEHVQYWRDNTDKESYWKRLSAGISRKKPYRRMILRKTMRYAALLIPFMLICGAGWYFFHHSGKIPGKNYTKHSSGLSDVHIMPKGKVAQLILANGQRMVLNDSLREVITERDGTKVHNQASTLSYLSGAKQHSTETLYNMLVTPRGGEYQVRLSDGTKVWLNAASSLRYPTQFNGNERRVYLSGEAYFEVAKDAEHPFIIHTDKTDITVLGTKFDVSAYPDDPVQKTTLAEGSVRINHVGQSPEHSGGVILKPGDEAVIGENEQHIHVGKANVEAAFAWKNGMFIFDGESLGNLMRKLSRWYNVDMKYDAGVDTLFHFTGRIQRYEDITGILHLIELTGKVTFSIKGHEVKIMPK